MKIGQKIILGFASIAMLLALAGTMHIVNLNHSRNHVDQVISSNLKELESAENVFSAIQETHSCILQLLLDFQKEPHEGHKAHFTQSQNAIDVNLQKAKKALSILEQYTRNQIELGDPEGEMDELREVLLLGKQVDALFELVSRVYSLLDSNEVAIAKTLSEDHILPITIKIQSIVSDLEMDAQEEIDAALVKIRSETTAGILASTIITIMALMAAIGLGLYLSRSISANVRLLHSATSKLGEGKLDTRVEINSSDELGLIASDINTMAIGLREAIVSRDDLAKEAKGRLEAEKELQISERKFRSIFESSRDTFMLLDHEGFLDCNDATLHMFNCASRDAFLGHHPSELSPATQSDGTPSFEAANRHIETALNVGYDLFEWTHQRKSGEEFSAEVLLTKLTLDGVDLLMASVRDITERKLREIQVRENEEMFRSITNSVNDALILLNPEGIISQWNISAESIFGYSAADVIGKELHEFLVPDRFRDGFRNAFPKFQITGDGEAVGKTLELAAIHKGGHEIPIELSISSVKIKQKWNAIGIVRDISERKRAEESLRAHQEETRLLLNSTAEAIYGVDTRGNCTLVNSACLTMLGYDEESDLIGKNMHELIHHSHADGTPLSEEKCKVYQAYRQDQAAHVDDEMFWRKDGSNFPVSYWAHPIHKDESVVGAVVTFLDITEQVSSRSALKQSREQLQSALEGTIAAVAKAVGARDPYTSGHQQRVAELAEAIAREIGLDEERIKGVYLCATIHDIGKIQLPADILSKPSKLTDAEYMLIQSHPECGYNILKDVKFSWPVADVAYQHHERIDGSGYPQGLKGDQICLEARIISVADVVEAMNSHRPYRPGLGIDAALDEIRAHRGSAFDPDIVDACLKLFEEKGFSFE